MDEEVMVLAGRFRNGPCDCFGSVAVLHYTTASGVDSTTAE